MTDPKKRTYDSTTISSVPVSLVPEEKPARKPVRPEKPVAEKTHRREDIVNRLIDRIKTI